MAELLSTEGFETQTCQFPDVLSGQFADGIGMLVLTEEALESPHASDFLEVLRVQPSWSELPLVILTSGGESRRSTLLDFAAGAAGAVTLLERPVGGRTLIRSFKLACALVGDNTRSAIYLASSRA